MNTVADTLTVNMVLTVRKVVSLLASIAVFNNTFTLAHYLGAGMVFGGAMLYSLVTTPGKPPAYVQPAASPTGSGIATVESAFKEKSS